MRRVLTMTACFLLAITTAHGATPETKHYIAVPDEATGAGCATDPGIGSDCYDVPAGASGHPARVVIADDRATHVTGKYLIECVDENGVGPICPSDGPKGTGTFCDAADIALPATAMVLHIRPDEPINNPAGCATDPSAIPTTGSISVTWFGS